MDLIVLIVAAALIVVAEGLVIAHTRPRPHGVLEYLWLTLPAVGVVVLIVVAIAQVVD